MGHSLPKLLSQACKKAGYLWLKLGNALYKDPRDQDKRRYLKDEKAKHLRYDYPLIKDSLIVDVGGYEGQWASDMFAMYGCHIHVFEPIPSFAEDIKKRFAQNPLIHIHPYGLGKRDEVIEMSLQQDGSSAIRKQTQDLIQAPLKDVAAIWKGQAWQNVDLIKINIEGGEYDLLERLVETGLIKDIRDLQIQFHDFVPDAEHKLKHIQTELSKTHHPTYQYPFVWENWTRNL